MGAGVQEQAWKITRGETLCAVLEHSAATDPERVFIKCEAGSISYGAFVRLVDVLAKKWQASVEGCDVCLFLPNGPAFLAVYFAVLRAGGRPALVNIGTPPDNFIRLVTALDPAQVFAQQPIEGFATQSISDADVVAQAAEFEGLDTPFPAPATAQPDDVCAILFTGGTTGVPKRINHRHAAIIAAMDRMEWGWPTQAQEIWLPVAPFTHVYGYLMGVTNPMIRGATLVIPPRFQPDLIVDMLVRERVTVFGGGPPAIYQALMAAKGFGTADLSALRSCPGGGAPFPVALHEAWQAATGLTIAEGYGMTEMAPISANTVHSGSARGSAGQPCPDVDIEIVDLETGERVLSAGQSGEIRVRGPHIMRGYEDNPKETAATLRHGFVYTGDIGMRDADGFLFITDRKKDVIFFKGFNVFPREVEEALLRVAGVQQACVVGLKDERAGEVVVAFVMADASVTPDLLNGQCREQLTAYKVPEHICVERELPLTPNGKLDRLQLRDLAARTFGR